MEIPSKVVTSGAKWCILEKELESFYYGEEAAAC